MKWVEMEESAIVCQVIRMRTDFLFYFFLIITVSEVWLPYYTNGPKENVKALFPLLL